MEKEIWEGWTAKDFIEELEPIFDLMLSQDRDYFKTHDLKRWCMDNQPYYKRYIPEVYNYFKRKIPS